MDKQSPVWTDEQIREYSNQITSSGFLNGWIFNLVKGIRDEVLNAWQADHDALEDKAAASYQSGMSDERAHQNALSEMVKRAHQEEVDALQSKLDAAQQRIAELEAQLAQARYKPY